MLGEQRCTAQRADGDHRRQVDPLRDCSGGGEGGERLDAVVQQPVEDRQRGERSGVCTTGPLDEKSPVATGCRRGKTDSDPHRATIGRMRSRAWLAVVALAALAAACSDDAGGYCEQLAEATDTLTGADPLSLDDDGLARLQGTAAELYDTAPGLVVDDWRVVVASYDEFERTLRDAGLTAHDLVILQASDPESVDPELVQKFGRVSADLGEILADDELARAADAIADHATTECDVDMTP